MEITTLVEKMINDDEDAFNKIIDIYYQKAINMAYFISGNKADSEDIVQESFIKCYNNKKKIKEPQYFQTWLYKIITTTAYTYLKKHKNETPVDQIYESETIDSLNIEEDLIQKENQSELIKAVMKLPVKQRTVITLYYYNQLSVKEIAKITSSFEGTVKSRLSSGRKEIKQFLLNQENKEVK